MEYNSIIQKSKLIHTTEQSPIGVAIRGFLSSFVLLCFVKLVSKGYILYETIHIAFQNKTNKQKTLKTKLPYQKIN